MTLASAEVRLDEGYVRLPPPNARSAAGYGVVVNDGEATITISEARAPRFGMAMLHETIIEDGVSRMRHLDAIEVEPGERFEFVPNGPHMMLMRPEAPLDEGEIIVVELEIDDEWVSFELPVRRD